MNNFNKFNKIDNDCINIFYKKNKDFNINLDSTKEKNTIIKLFIPIIYKIISNYVNKHDYNKYELINSSLIGFKKGINEWAHSHNSNVCFKTFITYQIQNQILFDINNLKISCNKNKLNFFNQNSNNYNIENIEYNNIILNYLYKKIEKKFKYREVDIFYRYFGLKNYKKEKIKDIAKIFKISEFKIKNSIINKILNYLKEDKHYIDILKNIRDIYDEALLIELFEYNIDNNENIIDYLINDDVFLLLEELNIWSDKNNFITNISNVFTHMNEYEITMIKKILSQENSYEDLKNYITNYKEIIIKFLKYLYPLENFYNKSEEIINNYLSDIKNYYNKYIY